MPDPLADMWEQINRAFAEQMAGTTAPRPPDPLPARDSTPVPQWPAREGREL